MKVRVLDVAVGTKMFIGAPSRPMAPDLVADLREAVASVPEIVEAHLPQMFIVGLTEQPGQALVLVLEPSVDSERVMASLGPLVSAVVPPELHLDVWPRPDGHEMLDAVRAANCQIFARTTRPAAWWQFWRH